jgi:heterodisulfide reductase subunit A
MRPADGKPIRRVAWIQCVGSRNVMIGAGHCSSACCMFAIKEALLVKETLGTDVETTIFYMDMRTFGRDDQRYRDRAEQKWGVRFVRCRIHSVEPADDPGDLKLTYLDDSGGPAEGVYDLVVLSTGAGVQPALPPFLAERIEQGGVMALGPEAGLQAIRETVLTAHRATAALMQKIGFGGKRIEPPAADRAGALAARRFQQQPVIQTLILDNTMVNAPLIDWPAVEAAVMRMAGNVRVDRLTIDGPQPSAELVACVEEAQANRLLVVSNHLGPYRRLLKHRFLDAGYPAALVEWVDLNQDDLGMGHATDSTDAMLRSIRAAMLRLIHRHPLRAAEQPVENTALVIGAGPAGLSAAITLADQGAAVHLVEKAIAIGGNGPHILDDHQRHAIEQLMDQVKNHPRIAIHTSSHLGAVTGVPGRFEGWIMETDKEAAVVFGAAVIATGGTVASTDAYGLGGHPRIFNHFDFEKRTQDPRFAEDKLDTVVMIQCAGSREEPRNYCSRTCCLKSLENAIRVRQQFPDAHIVVFYRDIMTEGTWESVYAEARARKIRFIPFHESKPPMVQAGADQIIVTGFDPVMGEALRIAADYVSLAVGMQPEAVHDLGRMFSVPVTKDGFVQEADAKWRPVDTINAGVFVCGLARGPLRAVEAIAEGQAAALRALRLLTRNQQYAQRKSALVRHAICSRCYLCVEACPYGARFIDPVRGQVMVDAAGCQGCGTCATVCPNSATVMGEAEDHTIMGVIEAALG